MKWFRKSKEKPTLDSIVKRTVVVGGQRVYEVEPWARDEDMEMLMNEQREKKLLEESECYDCDGRGWEFLKTDFEQDFDDIYFMRDVFGNELFNNYEPIFICPWCDGTGIDNDN